MHVYIYIWKMTLNLYYLTFKIFFILTFPKMLRMGAHVDNCFDHFDVYLHNYLKKIETVDSELSNCVY